MPNEYTVQITRSAVRLQRRWVPGPDDRPPRRGGGTNAGLAGASTAGRVIRGVSVRSLNELRFQLSGLVWEQLGPRPALVTATYPGDWLPWADSGPEIRRHIERFKSRWRDRWGEPIRGVWVREFQERGAPHWHLYVGLPAAVSDEDYDRLVRRTIRRKLLERQVGKYEARRRCGLLRGEFGEWLLSAWSGAVGTPADSPHRRFGADVAPFFWGATVAEAAAGEVNWGRIADYLWKESGKLGQKTPPREFVSPGRTWGRWGVDVRLTEAELTSVVWAELRRVLLTLYRKRAAALGRKLSEPRGRDGLTVFAIDKEQVIRLLRWAEDSVAWKRHTTMTPARAAA
jgi:hypothetical protein